MAQKEEFDVEPFDISDFTQQIAVLKEELSALREQLNTRPAVPLAVDEPVTAPKPDVWSEYQRPLIERLKDTSRGGDFVYVGDVENRDRERARLTEAIGALSGGSAIPEIWAKDVFRCCPYPASAFWDNPYIKWHDDIRGKPGDTIHVVTVGKAVCGTAGCAEPESTAPTVGATAITLEEYQCSLYVCRNDLEDMIEDTLVEINNSLASCLDECIDNAFIANIVGTGSTISYGTAYITPANIAEAMGSMRNGTCEPVVMVMHPVVEARLLQNAQFVNAATWGDRSVLTSGHIVQYLGLDILVVPKGSLYVGTATPYRSLMLSRYAVHAARKRDPTIESQYLVQAQRKYIYASVRFGKSVVCNDGVLWILSGA